MLDEIEEMREAGRRDEFRKEGRNEPNWEREGGEKFRRKKNSNGFFFFFFFFFFFLSSVPRKQEIKKV